MQNYYLILPKQYKIIIIILHYLPKLYKIIIILHYLPKLYKIIILHYLNYTTIILSEYKHQYK